MAGQRAIDSECCDWSRLKTITVNFLLIIVVFRFCVTVYKVVLCPACLSSKACLCVSLFCGWLWGCASTVESAVRGTQLALEGPCRGVSQKRWSVLVSGMLASLVEQGSRTKCLILLDPRQCFGENTR